MTYINEQREMGNGVIVRRYSILSSPTVVYDVFEPKAGHSTITTIDGRWMGRIGTGSLPSELESLTPMSKERQYRVSEWLKEQYQRAYDLILIAYPHLGSIEYRANMGDITTTEGQ